MKNLLILFTLTLLQMNCSNSDSTNAVEMKTSDVNSIVYNRTSPTKDAQFTFDQSIAKYRFEWDRNKSYSFVDTQKPTEVVEAYNTMTFQEMENMTLDKNTALFWFWIDTMSQGKKRIFDNNDLQQVTIGAYKAFVYDSKYIKEGKKGAVYMALLTQGDRAIKFGGTAYGNVEKAREHFKQTAASIKFK